jgi:5,10-methenyltetrahydrofolate synthetase
LWFTLSFMVPTLPSDPDVRHPLRQRLLAARTAFVSSPAGQVAAASLAHHLGHVLDQLEPECLGVYWPLRSEFNAASLWDGDGSHAALPRALPFTQRVPPQMHYRLWDGSPPALKDECNIPAASGAAVVPDVVLVPCVGFTASGWRLGYGGGFFDRWLALHPHVTAIGIAWEAGRLSEAELAPQAHDLPLALIVTENGVAQG